MSNTTQQVPYETWIGFIPIAHQSQHNSTILIVENRKQYLRDAWTRAINAIA